MTERDSRAGAPITDDDDAIRAALEDVRAYPPTGKRTLRDNGSRLGALVRDDVELVREGIDHSWYKQADGRIHILSPWRRVDDRAWTREPDLADFDFS